MSSNTFAAPETTTAVVTTEPTQARPDLSAYRGPKILLVGCGGCGINIARMISKVTDAHTFFIDTGTANTFPGENLFVVGDGEGSGGVQDKHAEAAIKKIPSIQLDPEQVPDIAIICGSLSGGSGSFIGPYVTKYFLSKKIQCVFLGVLDSGSATQAENTVMAIGNLKSLAEKSGTTVDIMAFDNKSGTMNEVNAAIREKGRTLVRLITAPTMEIDRNDRRHFLDGTTTHDAAPGLRLINVFEGRVEKAAGQPIFPSLDTDVFESILHIRGKDGDDLIEFEGIPELTHFRKDGHFLTSAVPVLGVVSANLAPLNDPLKKISDLQDRISTHAKIGSDPLALPKINKKKGNTAGYF